MLWHLFIESGLHNIKRHMDFSLQECKIIIIPMDKPTVINRPMKFLGSPIFIIKLSLFVLLISVRVVEWTFFQ